MLFVKQFGVCLVLLLGTVCAETYKEVHPSSEDCAKQCYDKFMPKDQDDHEKCDSCCAGCRYLAIAGLTSHNNEVESEKAKTACYKTCEESGKDQDSCHIGCDIELKHAEKQLEDLNMDFIGGLGFNGLLDNFFGPSLLPFGSSDEGTPKVEIDHGKPAPQMNEDAKKQDMPVEFEFDIPVIDLNKGQSVDSGLDDFWSFLKELGFTYDDSEVPAIEADDKKHHGGHHAGGDERMMGGGNHAAHKGGEVRRGNEDENSVAATGDEGMAYLRTLWRDKNTVQILLISSIIACLLAIVWMLCNSSNDPIVKRDAATVSTIKTASALNEEPPSYNIIYGGDDKKFPILVVAGIEEEAGPLPDKVPIGNSTKI